MLIYKAYRYRIYPTKEQEELIIKTFGCARFVFNYFLALTEHTYEETGKTVNHSDRSAMLPKLRNGERTGFLKEVDSIALQASLEDLDDGYKRFFTGQNQKPKFKEKADSVQSYTTKVVTKNGKSVNIWIEGDKIRLPKLGFVKMKNTRNPLGRIINVTVRRKASGHFFASVLVEEEVYALPKTGSSVSIDLGLKEFAILSTGEKIENPRFYRVQEEKLAKAQRILKRREHRAKERGVDPETVKNYLKAKQKVAEIHEKIANQRKDFAQKLSTILVKNHDLICVEDLKAKNLLKNHCLAKSIQDAGWRLFVALLEYKCRWYGKELSRISQWFPSSQLCSSCGAHTGKKPLSVREWDCPECGKHHDRDVNAALNILREGTRVAREKAKVSL